jgi:hypothetical protein
MSKFDKTFSELSLDSEQSVSSSDELTEGLISSRGKVAAIPVKCAEPLPLQRGDARPIQRGGVGSRFSLNVILTARLDADYQLTYQEARTVYGELYDKHHRTVNEVIHTMKKWPNKKIPYWKMEILCNHPSEISRDQENIWHGRAFSSPRFMTTYGPYLNYMKMLGYSEEWLLADSTIQPFDGRIRTVPSDAWITMKEMCVRFLKHTRVTGGTLIEDVIDRFMLTPNALIDYAKWRELIAHITLDMRMFLRLVCMFDYGMRNNATIIAERAHIGFAQSCVYSDNVPLSVFPYLINFNYALEKVEFVEADRSGVKTTVDDLYFASCLMEDGILLEPRRGKALTRSLWGSPKMLDTVLARGSADYHVAVHHGDRNKSTHVRLYEKYEIPVWHPDRQSTIRMTPLLIDVWVALMSGIWADLVAKRGKPLIVTDIDCGMPRPFNRVLEQTGTGKYLLTIFFATRYNMCLPYDMQESYMRHAKTRREFHLIYSWILTCADEIRALESYRFIAKHVRKTAIDKDVIPLSPAIYDQLDQAGFAPLLTCDDVCVVRTEYEIDSIPHRLMPVAEIVMPGNEWANDKLIKAAIDSIEIGETIIIRCEAEDLPKIPRKSNYQLVAFPLYRKGRKTHMDEEFKNIADTSGIPCCYEHHSDLMITTNDVRTVLLVREIP